MRYSFGPSCSPNLKLKVKVKRYIFSFFGVNLLKVRVTSVISIRDPNGNLGKRIDLVEEIPQMNHHAFNSDETHKIVIEATSALQQIMPQLRCQACTFPKIILFLTEEESEQLGVTFQVNEEYDVVLENATMKFVRSQQDGEPHA